MEISQARTERVQMRVDPVAKRMLKRAAEISNTTVSGFVANHALEAASKIVGEGERIVVSAQDWNLIVSTLANPPEPNAELRRAFADHKRLISKTADERALL